MATTVDLTNISQIPGNECLGDSRDRINYNIDLLKEAIEETRTVYPFSSANPWKIDTCTTAGQVAFRVTVPTTCMGDVVRFESQDHPDPAPFIIKYDGDVGVGTTNPNEKLTVVGNISATGTLSLSPTVTFTGKTVVAGGAITATNTFIEVKVGAATKYIRLHDI